MAGVVGSNPTRPTINLRTNSNILRISAKDYPNQIFWDNFKAYLQTQNNPNTIADRINYAKKYYHILESGDPNPILSFRPNKQIHIMKALTALSKFTGQYKIWQQTIDAYNLNWSYSDSLALFHSITSENTSLETMLQWVRNSIKKPETYANIIIFDTLTGLRPSEACISIGLIQNDLTNYYNKEKSILEHLRFPEFFIRRTKKSYISIVNDLIIDIAKKAYEKPSYNALKLLLSRRGLDAKMYYCRKVFATWLQTATTCE